MHAHSTGRSSRAGRIRAAGARFGLIVAIHAAFLMVLVQNSPALRGQVAPVLVRIISSAPPAPAQERAPTQGAARVEAQPLPDASRRTLPRQETAMDMSGTLAAPAAPRIEATVPAPSSGHGDVSSPLVEPGPVAVSPPPQPVVPPRFDAAYLDNPRPEYPRAAKRMGEQGKVMLRVYVSASGAAEKVEIGTSSGSRRLDEAARLAVELWKFVPARQGAGSVAAWVIVPITFALEG